MKIFSGKVISKKTQKTVTVVVERVVVHPLYKKRYKRSKKYHVHDNFGVEEGQMVKFVASKPYSRLKRWKVIEIVNEEKKGRAGMKKMSGNKLATQRIQEDSQKTKKKGRRIRTQKK